MSPYHVYINFKKKLKVFLGKLLLPSGQRLICQTTGRDLGQINARINKNGSIELVGLNHAPVHVYFSDYNIISFLY